MIIFKYPITDEFTTIRTGKVLGVAFQYGQPTVWVEHEDNDFTLMKLHAVPTGMIFEDDDRHHVGTMISDQFVFHVYKVN